MTYLRLDTLSPVPDGSLVLWGPMARASQVRRTLCTVEHRAGAVPYLSISANWAVRLVRDGGDESRAARLAYLSSRDGWNCLYCSVELDVYTATVDARMGHLPAAQKLELAIQGRLGRLLLAAEARKAVRR